MDIMRAAEEGEVAAMGWFLPFGIRQWRYLYRFIRYAVLVRSKEQNGDFCAETNVVEDVQPDQNRRVSELYLVCAAQVCVGANGAGSINAQQPL